MRRSMRQVELAPPERRDAAQENEPREAAALGGWLSAAPMKLAQGVLFGFIFGFLLQKGGVAKFDILIGVLLLEDFTVVKVMLSAIVVGMIGVAVLHRLGVLELQIKETVLGSNIIGGLIFGVGFGLMAYCPGTTAAALGQGNIDAVAGMAGLVLGSYFFALSSRYTGGTITKRGNLGKVRLSDLVPIPHWLFVLLAALILSGVLAGIEWLVGGQG